MDCCSLIASNFQLEFQNFAEMGLVALLADFVAVSLAFPLSLKEFLNAISGLVYQYLDLRVCSKLLPLDELLQAYCFSN